MTTITTDGRTLADAATLARKLTGTGRRSRLTITDGRAEVETTDGETGIVEVVGHGSAIDGVRVAIAADLDAWRKLRTVGDVTIRETADGFTMTAGGVTSTLRDAAELATWPRFTVEQDAVGLDVRDETAAEVAATLRSVAGAAAHDDYARDVLRHVALRGREAAATDNYRLAIAEVPTDQSAGGHTVGLVPAAWLLAIPRRGVDRLTVVATDGGGREPGSAEVTYRVTTRGRTRRVTIVGRTSPGPFPKYGTLIPEQDDTGTTVVIPTGIGDVLGRMSSPVTMSLGDGTLTLVDPSGTTASMGTAIVGGAHGPGNVSANAAFLADLVDHVGEGASLYLRDGLRAMVADSDGRTALLMPMRVS
jgi:DNA polymerase III sliding clamp (beta) subunit (PCNA family)